MRLAMRAVNPAFIPRNHLVEAALHAAVERQDFAPFEELLEVLSRPYEDRPGLSATLRRPRRRSACIRLSAAPDNPAPKFQASARMPERRPAALGCPGGNKQTLALGG